MSRAQTAELEKAVFTDARPPSHRAQWIFFLSVIALLGLVYFIARDLLYTRLLYSLAQAHFERLASASVERIGRLSIDAQGDILLHDALATTTHRGVHREFFRADEVRLTFDGMPLREKGLRVMRVDLVRPVIQVRRETDGEWNLEWALVPGAEAPDGEEPSGPDLWKDYRKPDDAFPPNGVHIHDGTIVVTFASKKGRDAVWRMSGVRARLARVDGVLRLDDFEGDFYGGRVKADAEIPRARPLHIRQLKIDVRDADVSRMSEGTTWIPHPLKGTLNGVFSLTWDIERLAPRPITSGYAEIKNGDLWPLPSFSGIIHLLTLTPVEDKRLDEAVFEFTVEEDRIRVDKMYFLGYPVSLFGSGSVSLTGDWMDISFMPRLGKEDWNSILPVIGAPLDLLSNILKGLFIPVTLTGSFEHPKFTVGRETEPEPELRKLIEEKSPP